MTHATHQPPLSRPEWLLLAACGAALLLALFGPAVAQPAGHHHFADQRTLWGIPCALDVLSNLPFALLGLAGLARLAVAPLAGRVLQGCAVLFFAGLVATAAGSAWYHWQPDDAGLAVDRLGMTFAFAGLMGLAAASRVSDRAGAALSAAVLVLGPASIGVWVLTRNVLPWCVLQFGGMAFLLGLSFLRPAPGAFNFRIGAVIALYALAKVLELADPAVYGFTGQLVAGHALKHIVAALAALPVIAALGWPVQNAPAGHAHNT